MSTTADTRRTRHSVASGVATLVAGCLCVSLSACVGGGDGDGGDGRDSSFTAVSAATGSSSATTQADAPGAELSSPIPRPSSESGPLTGSQPLDVLPEEGTRLNITEVRTGSHDTFDRIVVELAGDGSPGWYIATDGSPTADGSGAPIGYKGNMALVIDVRGVETTTDGGAVPVHDVANRVVESVKVEGVYEGMQRVVVGLGEKDPHFTVTLLDSPTRIVVDVTRPD